MRRVRSPFVAEVIDADVTCDPPYIVTRYVRGQTLDQVVSTPRAAARRRTGEGGARGGVRAGRRARGGRGAPGPEAGQHHALRRGARRDRLRHRALAGLDQDHPDRNVHGHPRVSRARGHRGRAERPGVGRAFLGRHDGLRGYRPPAVRLRLVRDDLLPDHARPAGPRRLPAAAAAHGGGRAGPRSGQQARRGGAEGVDRGAQSRRAGGRAGTGVVPARRRPVPAGRAGGRPADHGRAGGALWPDRAMRPARAARGRGRAAVAEPATALPGLRCRALLRWAPDGRGAPGCAAPGRT